MHAADVEARASVRRVEDLSVFACIRRIRLDAASGDLARQRTTKRSRKASYERFHGVGAGGEAKTGRPVSTIAQRRAVEDAGKAVEVIRGLD